MLARGTLGSGRTRGVSFWPFPNSSDWWWLISSVFLIWISCHKTTHVNGYYGAWPGWAVSISVLPLTNWCFWISVLEKTLESPLNSKEIKPVNHKGNQRWIFIGKTMLKLQFFGHLMGRANSLEKTLMMGKIKAGGEEGGRGLDGLMISSTQRTWVWVSSGRWWRTG